MTTPGIETKPRRKPASTSPTKRALEDLRSLGYVCQVVERWCPFSRRRIDLFGCIDIVGVREGGILGVQACVGDSHAARRKKAMDEPRLRVWLEAGGAFEIFSYAKQGARGKVKHWRLRREPITLEDFQ